MHDYFAEAPSEDEARLLSALLDAFGDALEAHLAAAPVTTAPTLLLVAVSDDMQRRMSWAPERNEQLDPGAVSSCLYRSEAYAAILAQPAVLPKDRNLAAHREAERYPVVLLHVVTRENEATLAFPLGIVDGEYSIVGPAERFWFGATNSPHARAMRAGLGLPEPETYAVTAELETAEERAHRFAASRKSRREASPNPARAPRRKPKRRAASKRQRQARR